MVTPSCSPRLPAKASAAIRIAGQRGKGERRIEVSFSVKRTLLPSRLSSNFELGRNVYGPIVKTASSLVSYWRSRVQDPSKQHGKAERLSNIIVGSQFEAEDDVGIGIVAREHDHRRLETVPAQDAHGFAAVDIGQADIHDDQIDLSHLGSLHALIAVLSRDCFILLVKRKLLRQRDAQFEIVVDHENLRVFGINSDLHSHSHRCD